MNPGLRRACRTFATITIPVAAAILFAPSEARGECGDYIVYTNPADAKPTTDHAPGPVKCQGPNCSQSPPPAPMPQAPPNLRILADQSLPLTGGESISAPEHSSMPFDSADASPVRHPSDIYHPPR
jgi:hypothetical protein